MGTMARRARQFLPIGILVLFCVVVLSMGWLRYLTFETIGMNYESLRASIAANTPLALLVFVAVYVAIVSLSLPGGSPLTLAGGLLFGWQIGAPVTVIAATMGATILYLIARTSFADALAARAGPSIESLRKGFQENAFSYLLFLRLAPVFPFVVVNLAAALLGVPLRTYVLGTLIGIIPATFAFSFAGAGLGSVIAAQNEIYQACLARKVSDPSVACQFRIDTGALLTRELVLTLVFLALVALLPVVIKRFKAGPVATTTQEPPQSISRQPP